MAEIAVRIIIEGRVQGVGYRMWMVRAAWQRDVRGWVRNRHDGSVEALLVGRTREVEALIELCRRGPRLAQVSGLVREEASDDGTPHFYERPTV